MSEMFEFSDNFISAARFDSDIHEGEFMKDIREQLVDVAINRRDYPDYDDDKDKHLDVFQKYEKILPCLFCSDRSAWRTFTRDESSKCWNYVIDHYDELFDYFDNYQSRFIECCPIELKCEVVGKITDEYYVLDRFNSLFHHGNTELMQKNFFYILQKYL
jgi:hypothetical protein